MEADRRRDWPNNDVLEEEEGRREEAGSLEPSVWVQGGQGSLCGEPQDSHSARGKRLLSCLKSSFMGHVCLTCL